MRLILRAATGAEIALGQPDNVSVSFADRLRFHLEEQRITVAAPGDTRHYWAAVQRLCSELLPAHQPFRARFLKTHAIAGRFDVGAFPDPALTSGVIHIVRDPRDVALSMAHHFSISLEQSVARLLKQDRILSTPDGRRAELVADWGTHCRSWENAPLQRKLLLRYEDMLDDPEDATRKILKHCGVAAKSSVVRRCVEATGFRALQSAEARDGFVEAPRETFFRAGKSGQWRDVDPAVFKPIIERYEPRMQALGYV